VFSFDLISDESLYLSKIGIAHVTLRRSGWQVTPLKSQAEQSSCCVGRRSTGEQDVSAPRPTVKILDATRYARSRSSHG
jgi:hypothetical protein